MTTVRLFLWFLLSGWAVISIVFVRVVRHWYREREGRAGPIPVGQVGTITAGLAPVRVVGLDSKTAGDSDCDAAVTAVDAALVLQLTAGLGGVPGWRAQKHALTV